MLGDISAIGFMFHSYRYFSLDDGCCPRYPIFFSPKMENGWIDVESSEMIIDEERVPV